MLIHVDLNLTLILNIKKQCTKSVVKIKKFLFHSLFFCVNDNIKEIKLVSSEFMSRSGTYIRYISKRFVWYHTGTDS